MQVPVYSARCVGGNRVLKVRPLVCMREGQRGGGPDVAWSRKRQTGMSGAWRGRVPEDDGHMLGTQGKGEFRTPCELGSASAGISATWRIWVPEVDGQSLAEFRTSSGLGSALMQVCVCC